VGSIYFETKLSFRNKDISGGRVCGSLR